MAYALAFDLNQMAIQFHDRYARQPLDSGNDQAYKAFNHRIITELQRRLGNQHCSRLEFTGSAYEGTQIGPDVEFDVMMVRPSDGVTAYGEANHPGFVYLFYANKVQLNPVTIMQTFKGAVQIAVHEMNVGYELKLRDHGGPAIQLDVQLDISQGGALLYSVDLVPTYSVGGRFYIAKPLRDENLPEEQTLNLWRDSASPNEKVCLEAIDRDNGCRKQVFRICKAVRVRQPNLGPALASVLLKNVLLKEIRSRPSSDWRPGLQGERTLDLLRQLAKALHEGQLPKFFVPEMNLLQNMLPVVHGNMRDRLYNMVRDPRQIFL